MINNKKVAGIIQARCTSTRMPLKHLRKIGEKLMIDWVVDRLLEIKEVDEIIVSSTNQESDKPLKDYCEKKNISFYGYDGSIDDVVGRHYNAVKKSGAEYILYVSGDCPLADSNYLREALYKLEEGYDAIRPVNFKEYMVEGMEIFNKKALNEVQINSETPYERENFFFIVERKAINLKVGHIRLDDFFLGRNYRISVDNIADLRMMNKLYEECTKKNLVFDIRNCLSILRSHKTISKINSHIGQKKAGEKNYRIMIKTEANREIGLGHLSRMTVLGEFLNENKNNGVIYAVNRDASAVSFLEKKGYLFDYIYCDTVDELIEMLNNYETDILIIDEKEEKWYDNIDRIRRETKIKIVAVDNKENSADLVILQGMQESEDINQRILSGMNSVFIGNSAKLIENKKGKKILLSFGGTDKNNVTLNIIKIIDKIKLPDEVLFSIVIGPFYKYEEELKAALKNFSHKFEIIKNVSNIYECFDGIDKAVIFHGVTFYETYNCEIPSFCIVTGTQFMPEMEKIENNNYAWNGGNYDNINEEKLREFLQAKDIEIDFTQKSDMEKIYEKIISGV